MKKLSMNDKRRFLVKKGYNLIDKDPDFINSLYHMYRPLPVSPGPEKRQWKMWDGTNRPPQFRH